MSSVCCEIVEICNFKVGGTYTGSSTNKWHILIATYLFITKWENIFVYHVCYIYIGVITVVFGV